MIIIRKMMLRGRYDVITVLFRYVLAWVRRHRPLVEPVGPTCLAIQALSPVGFSSPTLKPFPCGLHFLPATNWPACIYKPHTSQRWAGHVRLVPHLYQLCFNLSSVSPTKAVWRTSSWWSTLPVPSRMWTLRTGISSRTSWSCWSVAWTLARTVYASPSLCSGKYIVFR